MIGNTQETTTLPFNKKLIQAFDQHIHTKKQKIDLDIIFGVSFYDMSNQFTHHLYTHQKSIKKLAENYKKLTQNPIVIKM
jgi:hypothetical protein